MEFTRKVEWSPAYNKRAEGYGIHGMEVRFVLIGEKAAIQFLLSTNWQHSTERAERPKGFHSTYDDGSVMCFNLPTPADIGYHAREPQYGAQDVAREHCKYLDAPCYYDGSGLRARHFFDVFTDGGEEALWKALEGEYEARFVVGVPVTIDSANMGEMLHALSGALSEEST